MGVEQGTDASRDFSSRRVQNVLLVAQFHLRQLKSEELQRALGELRTAFPGGSAIMSYVARREGASFRDTWARLSTVFLFGAGTAEARHLGAAHLFEPVGLRALPMRLLFRVLERQGGDFPRHGNKIVSSVEEAADWLAVRLAGGPVQWERGELRDIIASFVRDNPLPTDHQRA